MSVYSYYLIGSCGTRAAEPCETHECVSDAEALQRGCQALRRCPESASIEIWREAQRLLRLGGDGRGPCEPDYLGRWDRAWAR